MLLWGNPSKFVSGSWDPKKDKNEIRLIDDGRTAERLLNWINKQIGRYGVSQSIAYFSITIVVQLTACSFFLKLMLILKFALSILQIQF